MKSCSEKKSSKYFKGIFKTTSEGILIVDTGGHILESNPALDKLLGYKKGELKGKLFNELVHKRAGLESISSAVKIHHFKQSRKFPLEM